MQEKRGEKENGREKGECERKSGAGQSSVGEKRRERGWDIKGRMLEEMWSRAVNCRRKEVRKRMAEKRANVRGKVVQSSQVQEKIREKENGREKSECERKSGAGQSIAGEKR